MVRIAIAAGLVSILTLAALIAVLFIKGERPEQDAAAAYLEAFFAGDGTSAYQLATSGYRLLVLESELTTLSQVAAGIVGPDISVTIVGSERTIGSEPLESLVGYTATSAVGAVEGIVTLFQQADGTWQVSDASYRFPDATDEVIAPFTDAIRTLNEQIELRLTG